MLLPIEISQKYSVTKWLHYILYILGTIHNDDSSNRIVCQSKVKPLLKSK